MPISASAIQYEKSGFRVRPEWTARSKRMIIYCLPQNAEPWPVDALIAANDQALKDSYAGVSFGSATQSFTFSPGRRYAGQWLDIHYCELGRDDQMIEGGRIGSFFFGKCFVRYAVKTVEVSDKLQAVRVRITNLSGFDLIENGIGYAVNDRRYPVPVAIRRGETVSLPQFETTIGARVRIGGIEGGYPVEAEEKSGKE